VITAERLRVLVAVAHAGSIAGELRDAEQAMAALQRQPPADLAARGRREHHR
jgi:hypothetical protein